MTMTVDKVLYTSQAHTTGGRNGASRSSDGHLDIKLSSPGAPGPGNGTKPEQRCWVVGLFQGGDGGCGRQDEGTVSHVRNEN
jgi:organic hydroperoxide reductase OsmC/OhrA